MLCYEFLPTLYPKSLYHKNFVSQKFIPQNFISQKLYITTFYITSKKFWGSTLGNNLLELISAQVGDMKLTGARDMQLTQVRDMKLPFRIDLTTQ